MKDMWLVIGAGAIITAILGLILSSRDDKSILFGFLSISLTALTVCSFYSDGATRVLNEDWSGLMDIMPTMSKALWVCVIISILVNFFSIFFIRKSHCAKLQK